MVFKGADWPWPAGLEAYRILEIPRRDDGRAADAGRDKDDADPGRTQRAAAIAAAYHAGLAAGPDDEPLDREPRPIAFGWIRADPGGPVRVLVAGQALVGSAEGHISGESRDASPRVLFSLPGGARGIALPHGGLTSLLGQIACWREIAGISDGLLASAAAGQAGGQAVPSAPGLEDGLMGSWHGAFGWMIIATPIPATELRTFADDMARRLHLAETAGDRFPERAVEAKRLTERHAEVRRGASTGFWHIRVAAGARDAASAAQVAGLFCGSAGLAGLPYTLIPAPGPTDDAAGNTGAGGPSSADYDAPATPFRGSTELLAALSRPPSAEVPGFRLALRPEFDATVETAADAGGKVRIGDILDRNLVPAGPFAIPLESLNRHVFVCGATGAGKSQTIRALLEAATSQGIPWLVVEPAKAEYRLMANRLPAGAEVIRIRPGEADAIAAGLNPLVPAAAGGATFPLQTHADLVRALFVAAFRSDEPFPQVLSAALTRAYEEAGWDLALGEPALGEPGDGRADRTYPTLGDLQRTAERVVTEIGYSQRVTDDVLGFIRVRIASLRTGTTGRFTDGGHPIDFAALLRHNVVLEIEDVGDDRDKAFLMGTVLIRLAEHLRLARGDVSGLRHLTVIEEAHRLLRAAVPGTDAGAGAHAVEMFAGLLAEIRAYGEGLVIAEQIPSKIITDAVKNSAVKLTHRLPAADDRDTVGATMNVTPAQSRYLVTLPPGQAAAFTDGMDFPVLVRISDGTRRESRAVPRTRDCGAVVTPRSDSCGPECEARPCTLREMRQGQQVLVRYPWLPLWAELTVLGHVAGWPMPVPRPAALAALRELPPRLAQCAVSHAVDAAVASRRPALVAAGQPAAGLAAHACAAIRTRAERDSWLCASEEPRWQVAGRVTAAVVFGSQRPSVLKSRSPRQETASPEELLADFVDCQWPLRYLAREDY